jgi:hypothetical protein
VARTARTLTVALAVALPASACTPVDRPAASSSRAPASPTSERPAARSAPLRVRVTHVAGRLGPRDRRALTAAVSRTLTSYVDAAFLGGRYPRSDFSGSLRSSFTAGAARRASGDLTLLTNRSLGSSTRSVRATRRTAYLSVLAPRGEPVGVTAASDLAFVVDRGDRGTRRVRLRGRLLLTPVQPGRWRVFGYDLTRSSVAAGGAS